MKVYKGKDAGMSDHSTHSFDGHFFGLDFEDISENLVELTARIMSTTPPLDGGFMEEKCIKFSYFLDNVYENSTTFGYEVLKVKDGDLNPVLKQWEISGTTNKLWLTQRIPITWVDKFKVQFFIKSTVVNRGTKVFIDDFTLSFEDCQESGCLFENGDACSMEPVPMLTANHMAKDLAQTMSQEKVGSTMSSNYLNDYVEQLWQVFSPIQEDSMDVTAPLRASSGFKENFLMMKADDNFQRAVIVTERIQFSEYGSSLCLSFYVNKPSDSQAVLQVYQGNPWGGFSRLIFSMTRSSSSFKSMLDKWERINLLVDQADDKTLDVFFYFVGYIGNGQDRHSYIGEFCSLPFLSLFGN